MFIRIFSLLAVFFFAHFGSIFAAGVPGDIGFNGQYPDGTLASSGFTVIGILTFIQAFLLKVVVPLIVVGTALYIAYELFTAQGDDTKMKKAWKSIAYAA